MASADIGIDLGTASILVYVKGKGVVLKEPSVVAYDRDTNKIVAIGEEARLMLGRTPGNIVAIRPLRQGVISDYTITEKMLKYFIQKAVGRSYFGRRPRISVCVPSQVTEVEKKAVEDATYAAGARDVSTPAPPVGPALGQKGVNIMAFTKEFNERTKNQMGYVIPVVITVYADRSFSFITKTPPAAVLIKKAAGINTASGKPNKEKVATLTAAQVEEIAKTKMPDLNAASLEAACSMVRGTCRSMGIVVEG